MKIKKLGSKVSLIVTLMIAAIIGLTIWIVTIQTDNLVVELASKEAMAANISFQKTVQGLEDEAIARAQMIANSQDVIGAIRDNDS